MSERHKVELELTSEEIMVLTRLIGHHYTGEHFSAAYAKLHRIGRSLGHRVAVLDTPLTRGDPRNLYPGRPTLTYPQLIDNGDPL